MATIINISQGFADADGNRKANKTWKVVNTTLDDEKQLMIQAFLPLVEFEDQIPTEYTSMVDSAFQRFFQKGMFLLEEHYEALNDALDQIGFKRVVLSTDNNYFQPTLPGKYKPCLQAWKNNGKARTKEMTQVVADFNAGKLSLDQYRNISIIEQLIEEKPNVIKAFKRIDEKANNLLAEK